MSQTFVAPVKLHFTGRYKNYTIISKVDLLKEEYNAYELTLMEKYGKDAVINVQTGDITEKEKE